MSSKLIESNIFNKISDSNIEKSKGITLEGER